MTQKAHVMHGRDHCPGGADPIPCLSFLDRTGSYTEWALNLGGVWAYWPLQDASGDAVDLGPTGADLDPVGTPAYHAAGPNDTDLQYAVRLTGAVAASITDDSFVDTGDVLNAGAETEFSTAIWIRPDSGSEITSNLPIIGNWNAFRHGWLLYLSYSTRQLVWLTGNGSDTSFLLGPVIDDDVWTHVAVTRTAAGEVHMYVNGAEVETDTGLTLYSDSGHPIRVGAADFNGDGPDAYHFYGNLAGAVWVDHVLTGGEILQGYEAGTSGAVEGAILTLDEDGNPTWSQPTVNVDGTRYQRILSGTGITATDNTDGTVSLAATGSGFDPATATTWWFPLVDSDGTCVLDGDGNLIPTLIPL